jgi:hypothetical protein
MKKLTQDEIINTFKNINTRLKALEQKSITRDLQDDFPDQCGEPMVIGVCEEQFNGLKERVDEIEDKINFAIHKLDMTNRFLGISFFNNQIYLYGQPANDLNYLNANADYIRKDFEPMMNGKMSVVNKNAELLTEEFYVLKTCYEELLKEVKMLRHGNERPSELPLCRLNQAIPCERGLYYNRP